LFKKLKKKNLVNSSPFKLNGLPELNGLSKTYSKIKGMGAKLLKIYEPQSDPHLYLLLQKTF